MKTFLPALLIGCAVGLMSCSRAYYAPNAQNVPLFTGVNDARFTVAHNSGDNVSGAEVQTAFSPSENVGLMANYYNVYARDRGEGEYIDIAGGYYYPMNNFIFEVYGGYGNGRTLNTFNGAGYLRNNFNKFYLQPVIGFSYKYLDIAASARFAHISLYRIRAQFADAQEQNTNRLITTDIAAINNNRNSFVIEPALTIRYGWKYLKLQAQYTYSGFLAPVTYPAERRNLSIGLFFYLDEDWIYEDEE
ncbi:MAG TPA: hypothetical protein VEC12_13215 [Bacteroidia bacterium]|nr:hypothetical protein [Bacteroidia bacterium]